MRNGFIGAIISPAARSTLPTSSHNLGAHLRPAAKGRCECGHIAVVTEIAA
jgi:hypothetical protein